MKMIKPITLAITLMVTLLVSSTTLAANRMSTINGYKSVGTMLMAHSGRKKNRTRTSSSRSRNNWSSKSKRSTTKSKPKKSISKKKTSRKLKRVDKNKRKQANKKRVKKKVSNKTKTKLAKQKAKNKALKRENKNLSNIAKSRSTNTTINRTTINRARDDYYDSPMFSSPSMFGYRQSYGYNSYGGFDGGFLISQIMVDAINARLWHSMSGNAGYSSMMSDYRAKALEEGNQEILDRLDEIEASVADSNNSGVTAAPIEEVLAEADIPVEVALDEEIFVENSYDVPSVRFGAGLNGGNYLETCQSVSTILSDAMELDCIESAGGDINLDKFCIGAYDAILTQSDLIADKLETVPSCDLMNHYETVAYDEVTFLIGNSDTRYKSVKDIPKGSVIYTGPVGSGPAKSWEKIIKQDPKRYGPARFKVRNADYAVAAQIVSDSNNTYMFYVSATDSKMMQELERTGNFRLIAMDDWDFNDKKDLAGESIYEMIDMPKGIYPTMQKRVGDYRNLSVQAVIMLNSRFADEYGEEMANDFITAIEISRGN